MWATARGLRPVDPPSSRQLGDDLVVGVALGDVIEGESFDADSLGGGSGESGNVFLVGGYCPHRLTLLANARLRLVQTAFEFPL